MWMKYLSFIEKRLVVVWMESTTFHEILRRCLKIYFTAQVPVHVHFDSHKRKKKKPTTFQLKCLHWFVSQFKPRALCKVDKWQTVNCWHQQLSCHFLSFKHATVDRSHVFVVYIFIAVNHTVKCNNIFFLLFSLIFTKG